MRRMLLGAAALGILIAAAPASAQTTPASQRPATALSTPASTDKFYISVTGGAVAVQNVSGGFAGELGMRLSERFDVFGEAAWMQNVATRRRIDLAALVASSLQASQGKPTTSNFEANAFYGGGGIRVNLTTKGRVRPYVTIGAGGAHVTLKPAFTVGGSDVTANLSQYGVTLGRDLAGEETKPAYSGGFGVQFVQGRWYADASVRVTSIQTDGQTTSAKRAGGGIGVRF